MPVKKKPMPNKKRYFTPEQANAMLPLVRVIVRDITELAHDLRDRHERLSRLRPRESAGLSDAHREEIDQASAEIERGKARMTELEKELSELGIELKDYFIGLIDFPCWMEGREVLLCWRHGEAEVGHWHEVDAGFANRKKLSVNATV
jgi:hypothetical protein